MYHSVLLMCVYMLCYALCIHVSSTAGGIVTIRPFTNIYHIIKHDIIVRSCESVYLVVNGGNL